jgi:hypothetical protein
VRSYEHRSCLELLHGRLKALVQDVPARDMDLDGI